MKRPRHVQGSLCCPDFEAGANSTEKQMSLLVHAAASRHVKLPELSSVSGRESGGLDKGLAQLPPCLGIGYSHQQKSGKAGRLQPQRQK